MIRDPWGDCLLKAEHDHRVREARLGFESVERLLVMRLDREPWLVRLARRLHLDGSGASGLKQGEHRVTPDNQPRQGVVVALPAAAGSVTMKPARPPEGEYWRRAA
jgi:hypothetical protein